MSSNPIRFDDAAAYERYMGAWSQLVGTAFLDWLGLPEALTWLDIGCGNGAFTELILEQQGPAGVHGIDPSEAQLEYARARLTSPRAHFRTGDAMSLPFQDDTFDAAVMPLVIFFVPDPAAGVAEMARVVSSGGTVAAYAWDMPGGGFPYHPVRAELSSLGIEVPSAPSPEASRIDVLQALWEGARLDAVETTEIVVERTFTGFEDYWETIAGGPSVGRLLATLPAEKREHLRSRLMKQMPDPDPAGGITITGRANAVRGRVPS